MTADANLLERARTLWLATVRPDGRPHLVPIWFVVDGGRWYICTAPGSVKARNLQSNPRVALAVDCAPEADGDHPYVIEGLARAVSPPPEVVGKFKRKFDWDITDDAEYGAVFEITVTRQVLG